MIDPRSLTREGLAGLLQRHDRFRVLAVPEPGELHGRARAEAADAAVILFNIGAAAAGDDPVREQITALVRGSRGVPVVLVSDREGSEAIGCALRLGVRGYIPTTLSGSILIEAVRLVQAGGTFVPAHAFAEALSGRRAPATDERSARLATLTRRQQEVLDLLRRGKPNKIIAHELAMQESTVKVHVRQIMRKLQARNRTQVAFLAAQAAEMPSVSRD